MHRQLSCTEPLRGKRGGHRSSLAIVVTAIAGMLWLHVGCERRISDPETGENAVSTVLLVTIDTWRRDSTGFLGRKVPTPTPFLDELAKTGVVLSEAAAPVPLTGPSHWSMLTGRWPWRDGIRLNGDVAPDGAGPTLAELLRNNGWVTAGFVSCSVLASRFGFARGFDHFDDSVHGSGDLLDLGVSQRRADVVTQTALDWIAERRREERVFVWVHFFDPHAPYDAPIPVVPMEHGEYLAEVKFVDSQLRRFAEGLEDLGRPLNRTMWVVLSDHGEGLGEHGEPTHGLILHGATTRIPFLVAGPGVEPREDDGLASTVDVFPTILDSLDLTAPEVDGHSVLQRIGTNRTAVPMESMLGRDGFGLAPVYGLRTREWFWEASPEDHLWNSPSDPDETIDLAETKPSRVAALSRDREAMGLEEFERNTVPERDSLDLLRSLGYVGSGATSAHGDVREFCVEGFSDYLEMMTLQDDGEFEKAELLAKHLVYELPHAPSLWAEAGFVAVGLGRMPLAEERFRRALEIQPDNTMVRVNLANVLLQQNRLGAAETEYRRVLSAAPEDLTALYNLGMVLVSQERLEDARVYWSKFVELYPSHPSSSQVRTALRSWQTDRP